MLLEASASVLLVIDVQARLMPVIAEAERVLRRIGLLLEGARELGVPVLATEQYPKGLGPTVDAIAERLPNQAPVVPKITFSAAREPGFGEALVRSRKGGRHQLVICGVETHVCVLQTAADLKSRGEDVYLVTDACGSRAESNRQAAIARASHLGIEPVSTEMVLFEWLERAGTDPFRRIQQLVR